MAQHISTIERINGRIPNVTLDHKETHTPITLLVTYAPRKGYANQEKRKHWDEVGQVIETIPKKHTTIWGADANGQLSRDPTRPEQYNKIIGPYTYGKKLEKGNGVRLSNTCYKHQMIPMNTWNRPPLTTKAKTNSNRSTQQSYKNLKSPEINSPPGKVRMGKPRGK